MLIILNVAFKELVLSVLDSFSATNTLVCVLEASCILSSSFFFSFLATVISSVDRPGVWGRGWLV